MIGQPNTNKVYILVYIYIHNDIHFPDYICICNGVPEPLLRLSSLATGFCLAF